MGILNTSNQQGLSATTKTQREAIQRLNPSWWLIYQFVVYKRLNATLLLSLDNDSGLTMVRISIKLCALKQ